jgi:hypothetical protein
MELETYQPSDSILAVTKENQALKLKADEVDSKFNSLVKQFQKKKINPVSHKIFLRPNKSYDKIPSQIQYDQIVEHIKVKRANYSKEKEKIDLKDCTFKPAINPNSQTMVTSNYVKPVDRPLPKKLRAAKTSLDGTGENKPDGITEDIPKERLDSMINKQPDERMCLTEEDWEKMKQEALEKGEPEPPKPEVIKKTRKINERFYEEQYMWKTQIEHKYATERLYLTKKEFEGFNPIPKVNKEVNEKLVKTDKDFLSRLQDDLKKSKVVLKTLEQKYYGFDFKPQINQTFATSRNIQSTYRYEPSKDTTRRVNKGSVDKNPTDNRQYRSENSERMQIDDPPSLEIGKGKVTNMSSQPNAKFSQINKTSDVHGRKPTNLNHGSFGNSINRESRETNFGSFKGPSLAESAPPVAPQQNKPHMTEEQRKAQQQKEIMKMFQKKFK